MKILQFAVAALGILLTCAVTSAQSGKPDRVYEMRTYYAPEGKLEDLHKRFRDHTLRLFKKHNIENVGYFVPVDNKENKLIFLLGYPSREAREASWKAFFADPDWQDAQKKSEANGKIVSKAVSEFYVPTDYSPALKIEEKSPRVFELRTYTAAPGKFEDLHARFRDHTVKLFEKHGMQNIIYLRPMADQPGADNKLVYFIAHKDDAARRASFGAFGQDPAWQSARSASEKNGTLTERGGVKSEMLKPTDYSPLK